METFYGISIVIEFEYELNENEIIVILNIINTTVIEILDTNNVDMKQCFVNFHWDLQLSVNNSLFEANLVECSGDKDPITHI